MMVKTGVASGKITNKATRVQRQHHFFSQVKNKKIGGETRDREQGTTKKRYQNKIQDNKAILVQRLIRQGGGQNEQGQREGAG